MSEPHCWHERLYEQARKPMFWDCCWCDERAWAVFRSEAVPGHGPWGPRRQLSDLTEPPPSGPCPKRTDPPPTGDGG